jgi:hypothetical protein
MDTSGVLNALLRVSEAINTGKISLDQLYDRIPEARDTDPIATLFAMHGATLKE